MEILRLHLSQAESSQTRFVAPVHGFVIKHPQAGAILVDTGIGSETERLRDWRLVSVQAGEALAEHGLHPADVKLVVNTHLHFDHCGQNIVFRHAPFYVQRGELERARAEETAVHDWFDFAGARFELLEGDAEVAAGVRVVATPGHTSGHQCVIVDRGAGRPSIRRCVMVPSSDLQRMQTARSFMTLSAWAKRSGMGPNGSPLKFRSRPATSTARPSATSREQTTASSASKNCASSMATTSQPPAISSTSPEVATGSAAADWPPCVEIVPAPS